MNALDQVPGSPEAPLPELPGHSSRGRLERILRRGNDYLCDAAQRNNRIPPGHPEAFLEAFANVYNGIAAAIRDGSGSAGGERHDFPDVNHGARGVHFIERTVASAGSDAKWTPARWEKP